MTSFLIFLVLAAIFFVSGFFENFIYRKCTHCERIGITTSVSWMYEIEAIRLGYKSSEFKIGAIHSVRLCEKCYDEFIRKSCEIF